MQKQEFSYKFIRNAINGSGLKVVAIPLCGSKNIYSHIIYDYQFKDILYVLRRIYEVNAFNEKEIMDKYCDDDTLNYILHSETNIPAIAIVNAESFDMEVEMALTDLSTSKYFSIFQDMFLTLSECMNILETRKYELQDEYDELDNTYNRIKNAVHPTIELMKIYRERLKSTPFYKFKEKKKWKQALEYIRNSKDKISIVKNELHNLNRRRQNNIELQKNCGEEYLCLLSCQDYLVEYVSNRRVTYMDLLASMKKTVMEATYEQKTCNHYRNYNGREVFNSQSVG
jgi:hypothetical protein